MSQAKKQPAHSPGPNPKILKGDLEDVIKLAARLHVEAQRVDRERLAPDALSSIAETTGISEGLLVKAQAELERRRKRRWQIGAAAALGLLLIGAATQGLWRPLLFPMPVEARIILAESHRKEARELKGKKDYVAALRQIKQAVALDPNNLVALNDLGLILEDAGQPEEAKAVYRRMIEENERRDELRWAYYNLARLLDEEPATREEAIALYEKALEIRPDYAFALNNLGWVYERMNRYDDAIRYYQAAIDADRAYELPKKNLRQLEAKVGHRP